MLLLHGHSLKMLHRVIRPGFYQLQMANETGRPAQISAAYRPATCRTFLTGLEVGPVSSASREWDKLVAPSPMGLQQGVSH